MEQLSRMHDELADIKASYDSDEKIDNATLNCMGVSCMPMLSVLSAPALDLDLHLEEIDVTDE